MSLFLLFTYFFLEPAIWSHLRVLSPATQGGWQLPMAQEPFPSTRTSPPRKIPHMGWTRDLSVLLVEIWLTVIITNSLGVILIPKIMLLENI